ncbi:MAG: hypothetical protein NTW73_03270 [Candidatus Parcubacteria bacterium]|nr:hypothetical protein [Candidatus Parcubacteria bacterium]
MGRICSKCKKEKSLEEFFKASMVFKNPRINKDRKSTICKKCTLERTNLNRLNNLERYRKYGINWTKKNPERRKAIRQKYFRSPKGIYRNLIKRGKDHVLILQSDFINWYNVQPKYCFYCGIPENMVYKFAKGNMRNRLTIDRINPKGSYSINNIVLACGVCNFVKSDIFTKEEMLEVGKIIKIKWETLHD